MASPDEYRAWAERFAVQQGIRFPEEIATLASWRDALGGYSLAELDAARLQIARSSQPAPTRIADYRGWIHRLVNETRAERHQAEAKEDRGTCVTCGGSGMVSVPHPRAIRAGCWGPMRACEGLPPQYQTLAVYCSCALGRWRADRYRPKQNQRWGPLQLDQYDRLNPQWKHQLARRHTEDLAEARQQIAEGRGPVADDVRRLLQMVRERFRTREPGEEG